MFFDILRSIQLYYVTSRFILKKKHKRLIILSTVFIIVALCGGFGYFFRQPLAENTQHFLTQQTIPFHLVVDPKQEQHRLTIPAVDLSVSQMNDVQKNALGVVAKLNQDFATSQQNFDFLTAKQTHQLKQWVHDKPHQYIANFTPVAFGKNAQGDYVLLSANRYEDSKRIKSYRYRVFYDKNLAPIREKTQYVATTSHTAPPKFVFENVPVGQDGVSTAMNYLERLKNSLGKSSAFNGGNASSAQFRGLATELNLDTKSGAALAAYLKASDTDFKNTVITGYELTDQPRLTRFFLVSGTNQHPETFTLTYDRTQAGFTQFRVGRISADRQI